MFEIDRSNKTLQLTVGALFIALIAVGANLTTMFPFLVVGGVPITLQAFFSILAGLVLGARLGAFTLTGYTLLGLAGLPIFAQFKGGVWMLLAPTFGFLLSFIIGAYVAGKVREKYPTMAGYLIGASLALVINYVFGANWMYLAYQFWFEAPPEFSYKLVWLWLVVPLPKDIILAVCAGVFAYRLEKRGIGIKQPSLQTP